jgi:hypothetical protein
MTLIEKVEKREVVCDYDDCRKNGRVYYCYERHFQNCHYYAYKTEKMALHKPHRATLLLGVMFCIALFLISFGSAINWENNITAYWNLNSNSALNDSTGNNNNLSWSSAPLSVTGKIGNAVNNSGNIYANWSGVGTGPRLNETGFTLSAWVQMPSTSSHRSLFNQDGFFGWYVSDVGILSGVGGAVSSGRIDDGSWHHVSVTWDKSSNNVVQYIDGVQNGTGTLVASALGDSGLTQVGGFTRNSQYWNSVIDEFGVWNRTLNSSEISELYNDGIGLAYLGATRVTLISPVNATALSTIGTNFTATGENLSLTYLSDFGHEWKNITYTIWNSTGIFNETSVDINADTFSETLFIDYFSLGNYHWNVKGTFGNATFNNHIWASKNYTYLVGATISNSTFNNQTYETKNETFSILVNLVEGAELSLAKLIYNGTEYVVSDISIAGSSITLTRTIDIPLNANPFANQTNEFYWQFTYEGGQVQTLTTFEQNASFINFQLCNGTYTTQSLNFTFIDEINQTLINTTANPVSFLTTFDYWIGDGNVKKTYSFQNLSSTISSYQFCIYPNNLSVDLDAQYFALSYAERTYYFRNKQINSTLEHINLYNLLSTEATKFTGILKQEIDFISDAVVGVWKYFTGLGEYKQVLVGFTDDKGEFVANIDLDENYKFTININGTEYPFILKQAGCSTSPCEINLNIESEILSPLDDLYSYFAQNVEYNFTYNQTTKIVTLEFLDELGTAQYWRLLVYQTNNQNDTLTTICDEKAFAPSGTLTCNYTGYSGGIIAKVFISRSPEQLVEWIYLIDETVPEILGLTGLFASIIIILVIVFTGMKNPAIALILLPFSLVTLKFIGFLPLGWGWIGAFTIFDLWLIKRLNT